MMRTFIAPTLAGLLLSIIIVSAGEIPRPATGAPQEFLPEVIDEMHAQRSGELLIFRGDSLSEYTNSADFYQRFNFVDLATTEYTVDSAVMVDRWCQRAEADSSLRLLPEGIPYDNGKGFMIEHQRYGKIIIGTRNDVLAVMIGYNERHRDFLIKWLNSLSAPTE